MRGRDVSDLSQRAWPAGLAQRVRELDLNTGAITLLAAVAYTLVRVMYSIYYGLLGATPEQVGLGYAESLSQGFAFLVVLVIGLLAAWLVLGIPMQAALAAVDRRPSVAWLLFAVAFAAFLAAPLATIGSGLAVFRSFLVWAFAAGGGIALAAAGWSFSREPQRADPQRGRLGVTVRDPRAWPPLYALVVAVVAVALLSSVLAGLAVRDGFVVPPVVANVTGLRAEAVVVLADDGTAGEMLLGGAVTFVGEHGGTGVFFDPLRTGDTFRVNMSSVTVRIFTEARVPSEFVLQE